MQNQCRHWLETPFRKIKVANSGRKKLVLKEETATRKAVYVTYVTTEGLVRNSYANDVQSEVTLDDLFEV